MSRSSGPKRPSAGNHVLSTTIIVPGIADLRPLRQSKNLTLAVAAPHLGVRPATISALERGIRRDDALTHAYRNWLQAA
ncbi:helix-turn-helix domain-containing protein [Streptomyces sp. NPDC058459]|uniref:helix-turn-helix domain-containing protein n=1 Tax=Streptomyces sp. NPDC058459 TaxID=3346508 RepID=UPI00365AB040